MRKTRYIVLAIAIVLSVSAVILAASHMARQSAIDTGEMIIRENVDPEFVTAPCENVYFENSSFSTVSAENSVTDYVLTQMQFADTKPAVYVVSTEDYAVQADGTISLSLKTCVWAPEYYEIEIGFWNMETGTTYSKKYSEGYLDLSVSYPDLPAGTYKLFVVNNGPKELTTGYMLYQVD